MSQTTIAKDMKDAPQIQAGKLVADYLDHKLTFEQVNAKLEPLGYTFCSECYAHRWDLMKDLYADEDYIRICLNQKLYRGRLTPKPWRTKKLNEYPARACRFIDTVGTRRVHEEVAPLLAEHDRVTEALRPTGTLA